MAFAHTIYLAVGPSFTAKTAASLRSHTSARIAAVAGADGYSAVEASVASIAGALEISIDTNNLAHSACALVEGTEVPTIHVVNVLTNRAVTSIIPSVAVAFSVHTYSIIAIAGAGLVSLNSCTDILLQEVVAHS